MRVDIYLYKRNLVDDKPVYDLVPTYLGYADVDTFNAEEIFHLCNWSCWTQNKPYNLYADIESCGIGLCLTNPKTQEKWLAKSFGWLVGDDDKIDKYVSDHRYRAVW